jgi:hypothetical protein
VTHQVVVAWVFDVPLTLDFHPFETATVFVSVIIVNVIMQNGKSNYLDGLMLLALYLFVSLGFIMHDPEEAHCTQNQLWCVRVSFCSLAAKLCPSAPCKQLAQRSPPPLLAAAAASSCCCRRCRCCCRCCCESAWALASIRSSLDASVA